MSVLESLVAKADENSSAVVVVAAAVAVIVVGKKANEALASTRNR